VAEVVTTATYNKILKMYNDAVKARDKKAEEDALLKELDLD
jgi:hypothetical protein